MDVTQVTNSTYKLTDHLMRLHPELMTPTRWIELRDMLVPQLRHHARAIEYLGQTIAEMKNDDHSRRHNQDRPGT